MIISLFNNPSLDICLTTLLKYVDYVTCSPLGESSSKRCPYSISWTGVIKPPYRGYYTKEEEKINDMSFQR